MTDEGKTKKTDDKSKKEIEELKIKIEELDNKYKRALADYLNLEKRVGQEQRDWIVKANRQLIIRLLPILDTLMLAGEHVKDESLPLSIKQFLDILKSEGVQRIETVGQEFNPRTMQCVETIEGEEGKVMSEIRAGFLMQEEILRAALVRVGSAKQNQKE
ncbi:MAG: nucleotide exchange factor GrpE [Candidatus Levybacteria bacterium]|nr:nucleotide exchange factor GrpE [Candidatus Levybacteria bacterium]